MPDQWLRQFLWGAVPLSTLALSCMPLFGPRTMVAVIAVWTIVLLIRAVVDPVPISTPIVRWCAFLAMPFLLMLPDLARAPDLATGWRHVERSSALLLFPVGFLLLAAPAAKRFREAMLDIFSLAALTLAVYANLAILLSAGPMDPSATGIPFGYRAMFTDATGLHPPYAAYFFLTAALFRSHRALNDIQNRKWRSGSVLLLFAAALLLASRMPLIAFVAAALPIILLRSQRRSGLVPVAVLIIGAGMLLALAPGARQRMMELFNGAAQPSTQSEVNSTNVRLPIAQCTMEAIGEHWLLGVGQANAQAALDNCYRQFGMPMLLDGSYGTHNQLLHWWLCFGVIGPVIFLLYFFVLLRHAWQARDAVHLAFLIFMVLCMTTENLLARQWGVVLFACFNALFMAGSLGGKAPAEAAPHDGTFQKLSTRNGPARAPRIP